MYFSNDVDSSLNPTPETSTNRMNPQINSFCPYIPDITQACYLDGASNGLTPSTQTQEESKKKVDELFGQWQRYQQSMSPQRTANIYNGLSAREKCQTMTNWINSPQNFCPYPNPLVPTYFVADNSNQVPPTCGIDFNKQDLLAKLQTYRDIVLENPQTDKDTLEHIIWLQDWLYHLRDCKDYERLTAFQKERVMKQIYFLLTQLETKHDQLKKNISYDIRQSSPSSRTMPAVSPSRKPTQDDDKTRKQKPVDNKERERRATLQRLGMQDTIDYLSLLGKAIPGDYIVKEMKVNTKPKQKTCLTPSSSTGLTPLTSPSVSIPRSVSSSPPKKRDSPKRESPRSTSIVSSSITPANVWSKIRYAEPIQDIFDYPPVFQTLKKIGNRYDIDIPSENLPFYQNSDLSPLPVPILGKNQSGSPRFKGTSSLQPISIPPFYRLGTYEK